MISDVISKDCLISRMGGEEFCIVIFNRNKDEAQNILERIRTSFVDNIVKIDELEIKYTVSIGSSFDYGSTFDEMVNFADDALYDAKENGRNQVRYK